MKWVKLIPMWYFGLLFTAVLVGTSAIIEHNFLAAIAWGTVVINSHILLVEHMRAKKWHALALLRGVSELDFYDPLHSNDCDCGMCL